MNRSPEAPPAESFLPLTGVAFEILLALAGGERHGYAILQEVERRTGGAVRLYPGTLYRALARLVDDRLIEEVEGPDDPDDDPRRRYYILTQLGRRVAGAEAARLASQVAAAAARHLLPEGAR